MTASASYHSKRESCRFVGLCKRLCFNWKRRKDVGFQFPGGESDAQICLIELLLAGFYWCSPAGFDTVVISVLELKYYTAVGLVRSRCPRTVHLWMQPSSSLLHVILVNQRG